MLPKSKIRIAETAEESLMLNAHSIGAMREHTFGRTFWEEPLEEVMN